jgi:hypothetical protein
MRSRCMLQGAEVFRPSMVERDSLMLQMNRLGIYQPAVVRPS